MVVSPKRVLEQQLQEQVERDYEARESLACPYCKAFKALFPDAKACPDCGHLMIGDDCDVCYGKGPVIREAIERDFQRRLNRLPKLPLHDTQTTQTNNPPTPIFYPN